MARFLVAAISAVLPLLLARRFAQEEYGTYKQLFLIAQTIYYVVPLGIPQSLYFFLPRAGERRPYLVQALLYLAGVGALAAVALLLLAGRIGGWLNSPGFAAHAPALALYLFGIICALPLETSLTARGRTRLSAGLYLGSELFRAAAMTVPVLLGFGLEGVMAGVAAFGLLRAALTWTVVARGERGPWFTRDTINKQLRYALPFGAAMALGIPQGYFHQYAVAAHVSAADYAIYAVGLFQLPFVELLYAPTSEVLMVTLGELEREGRRAESAEVFRGAVSRLAYAFIPFVLFLVAAAPQFIATLFTPRYLGSVPIFRVAVVSTLFAVLPLDGVLRARGETWHILASNGVKAAVTVPAVLLGVWRFGMIGGVGGWLVSEIVGKAVLFARLPRALGAKAPALLPWAELGRAAAASLLAVGAMSAAVALLVPGDALTRPLVTLAVSVAAYGLAYPAGLLLVGARLPFEMLGLRRAPQPLAPRQA